MAEIGEAVLLDTNLLVLAAVGLFDRSLVGRKRLDDYSPDDADLLIGLIAAYPRNLTTPHLLAEVSNLTDQCVPKHRHREFRDFFRGFVDGLDERWMRASELCRTPEFAQLGLADAAVVQLAGDRTTVLSVDVELCQLLLGQNVAVENFNHLRDS